MIVSEERLAFLRNFFKTNMLPDTCTVHYFDVQVSDSGAWSNDTKVYREYDGTTVIPCRIDDKPFIRYMPIAGQETNINQMQVYFPYDFMPEVGDIITIGTRKYEMKKMANSLSWNWLNEGTVVEVVTGGEGSLDD